jgi:dolichol-phosphate mannosyltransferase
MAERTEPMRTLIIIPTYQEATNIDNVLTQVRQAAPEADVLVVDDNSPDGTADLVKKADEKFGRIDLLQRNGKSGLGSAYRAGFRLAFERGYDIAIEMDADLSHDPKDLPRLIHEAEAGADLVIGSRYVPGGAIPGWPAHRALLSRYGNRYATFVLGLNIKDATSGYRAYRTSVLRQVNLGSVRADGYGFQIEMAYRMARVGDVIREIPITFVDRTEGESKMSSRIIVEALGLVTLWGIRDRVVDPLRALLNKRKQ